MASAGRCIDKTGKKISSIGDQPVGHVRMSLEAISEKMKTDFSSCHVMLFKTRI
jgi:hypothetical protein